MIRLVRLLFLVFPLLFFTVSPVSADQRNDPREQAISDALDLWRDGRFEQLYDSLSQRSGMTRERFVRLLKEAEIRPACCFNKLRDFRLINEKGTTAKVFTRLGMETMIGEEASQSREFTLDYEEGRWKMRMGDIRSLAGRSGHLRRKR